MKPLVITRITLVIVAFSFAGCSTPQHGHSGSNFWIYIPGANLDKPRGAAAEVALPNLPYTTNRIKVFVEGEVALPGVITAPQGCTVLQAVGYAGGFTAFALTPRLKLTRPSGQSFDLHLRSRSKDRSGNRQVWYVLEKSSTADYVLDTGDKLYVRKTVL